MASLTLRVSKGTPLTFAEVDGNFSALNDELAEKAPLASPVLTGNPTAPTPSANDSDTSIATTAYVQTELADYAPLASPVLTGNPTAPTPSANDSDTSIATTAYVQTELADYAPLASPVLTGNPTAPTPAALDSDTSIATTAFVQAAVVQSGPLAGFRNAIINGNFDIWQRGVNATGAAHLADRWFARPDATTGGTKTQARVAFTAGQTQVPGEPAYHYRLSQDSATSSPYIAQDVEDVRTFAGREVTVSFYAKRSAASATCFVRFVYNYGVGGSPSGDIPVGDSPNFTVGTAWSKITQTITLPSISGATIGSDNSSFLTLRIDAGGTGTFTFDLAQVQLELGPVATPFERRPIGTELALCQRYYETSYPEGVVPATDMAGVTPQYQSVGIFTHPISSEGYTTIEFATEKRAVPSVQVYSPYGSVSPRVWGVPGDVTTASAFYLGKRSFALSRASASASTPATQYYEYMWFASAEL